MTTPPAGKHAGPQNNKAAGSQPDQHVVRRTRIGGVWVATALFALVLLLLLIFILENGQKVDISYFGTHGHLPLGVALLLAAVLGVLLVVIPGAGRILQLRIVARRYRKLGAGPARGQQPTAPTVSPGAATADTEPANPEIAPAGPTATGTADPAPAGYGADEPVEATPGDPARP
jgi:uncharacterized integral membrane protein